MASETRLIDANALFAELLEKQYSEQTMGLVASYYLQMRAIVANAPIVDAVEVVHARWEKWWSEDYITYFHKCSVCGEDALTKEETAHDEVLSNYCPYCGAKMDGGAE